MYVVRDKQSKKAIHVDYRAATGVLAGSALYSEFDAESMEVAWTDQQCIPIYFDIDASGRVVEVPVDEASRRGWHSPSSIEPSEAISPDIATLKAQLLESVSRAAIQLRAELIPDYKLQNAAIGVYDEDRVASYRATVNAFRNEVQRIEELVNTAKTVTELAAIKPEFPASIVDPEEREGGKKGSRKKQT